jgi:hypothetical protein
LNSPQEVHLIQKKPTAKNRKSVEVMFIELFKKSRKCIEINERADSHRLQKRKAPFPGALSVFIGCVETKLSF